MKTENLKKLAEIIVSENEENYDGNSIADYYKVLDYEDAVKLDDMFYELDNTMDEDENYIVPSAQFMDIWAGEFADVVKKNKPIWTHYENGKEIVDKYEKDLDTPFIEEHKKDIQDLVGYYAWNSERFHNNLLTIFKDYIDMNKVVDDVIETCMLDMDEEELLEQFNNGEAYC